MLRLYVALIAIFIALCSQANEFTVDPFEVFINHPQVRNEKGTLIVKKHIVLTFPYDDDLVVTNTVNEARQQNRKLKFTDYCDPTYPDQRSRFMQIADFFPYDVPIECAPEDISFHGAKRNELLEITFFPAYIKYKTGSRTKTIDIHFEHVEDYLASLIKNAKKENKKIFINTEALRHRKKQQYIPLNSLAYVP